MSIFVAGSLALHSRVVGSRLALPRVQVACETILHNRFVTTIIQLTDRQYVTVLTESDWIRGIATR